MTISKSTVKQKSSPNNSKETHFVVNEKDHSVNLTDEGIRTAETLAGLRALYRRQHGMAAPDR